MSFQILRRFWWVFVVLVSGLFTNTFAQDTSISEATPEAFQNLTMIVSREDLLTPEFTEAFSAAMLATGHPTQFITEAEFRADSADLTPVLRFSDENQSGIQMALLIHPLRELSPILVDLPDVVMTGSTDTQTTIAAIYALYAVDDCDEAINIAQTLVAQDADVAAAEAFNPMTDVDGFRRLLGWNCLMQQERDLANMDRIIITLDPPPADPLSYQIDITLTVNHAWDSLRSGSQEQAFAELDELARRWGRDAYATIDILRKKSQFYALINDFDSAMDMIEHAIDLATGGFSKPELAPLYIQRGQVHTLLYEWDNAIADYTIAINFAPEDEAVADAYYYRGFIYYTTLFDRERALPDFERTLDLAPFGDHRENALQYQADIEAEIEALSG
jgi:tetratricopeptide (TPR) repeat protein